MDIQQQHSVWAFLDTIHVGAHGGDLGDMAKRIGDFGLHGKMLERVNRQLRKYSKLDANGKPKLDIAAMEKWDDKDAFDTLAVATNRAVKTAIQEISAGNLHPWARTNVGRILNRFRSFTQTAFGKQSLRQLRYNDKKTYAIFASGMMTQTLAYMARLQAQSIGMPEEQREEFLKKRWTIEGILKGGFSTMGAASFAPGLIDALFGLAQVERPFSGTRSTALTRGPIEGSPTIDLLWYKLRPTLQAAAGSLLNPDQKFTQQDALRGFQMFPLQNMIGVNQVGRHVIENMFPESDKDWE